MGTECGWLRQVAAPAWQSVGPGGSPGISRCPARSAVPSGTPPRAQIPLWTSHCAAALPSADPCSTRVWLVKVSSSQQGWAERCRCHGLSSGVTDKASRSMNAHDGAWHTAHWVSSNPRIPSQTLVRSRNTCRSRQQNSEEGTAARLRLRKAQAHPYQPVHSRHNCK